MAVTVTDVGDVAPAFSSASSVSFAENATGAVYTAVVTPDVAGAVVTFAISSGADSAKFSINSSSGVVGFVSSPNFEVPTDSGGNNVYDIVITATEAGNTNTVTQSVAVTVTDVDEIAPIVKLSSIVKLEVPGVSDQSRHFAPDHGSRHSGEYVVVWVGDDTIITPIVHLQKFSANGQPNGGAVGLVDGSLVIIGRMSFTPQVTAVGTAGEFVVVWSGQESTGDLSIFVQKFAADGSVSASAVVLEATGKTNGGDEIPQITAVGTAGEYVVSWQGDDSGGDTSIFVQKFHANGAAVSGGAVKLEATGKTDGEDSAPQITAVGAAGDFVVTWYGSDSGGGGYSVFVQKFHANGAVVSGGAVQLESGGHLTEVDRDPQVTAVGMAGEFVVVWTGYDTNQMPQFMCRRFTASGSASGSPVALGVLRLGASFSLITPLPQVTAVGTGVNL